MSCKDIVPLENPLKVPRWSQTPSPARKLHKKQMQVERESFISSPPSSLAVDPDEIIMSSPREMEVKVERIKGKEQVTLRIIDDDDGVYMAWKDLWVSVPEKKKGGSGWRPILEGCTGYVEPGEVLAIMGPSGSGKFNL